MGEFRVYRKINPGEFFIVAADSAQGGGDFNMAGFASYTNLDFPITYWNDDVASTATPELHRALEFLYRLTGVPPLFTWERNNGGASEMERMRVLNKNGHYELYIMKNRGRVDGEEESSLLGWVTSATTRPYLIGDYKDVFKNKTWKFYDKDMLAHHKNFIKGRGGKPQASTGNNDDAVIVPAIVNQLYQTERPKIVDPNASLKRERARLAAKNIMKQMKSFY